MVKNSVVRGANRERLKRMAALATGNRDGGAMDVPRALVGRRGAVDIVDNLFGSRDGSLKVIRSDSWSGKVGIVEQQLVASSIIGWNILLGSLLIAAGASI